MAKLKARGRTEIVRLEKTIVHPSLVPCDGCEGTGKRVRDLPHTTDFATFYWRKGDTCESCEGKGERAPSTTQDRYTVALMTDGNVLSKLDVVFPDRFASSGTRPHSYGWKVKGKLKAGLDSAGFQAIYEKKGYTATKSRV